MPLTRPQESISKSTTSFLFSLQIANMPQTIAQKLKIREGDLLRTLHAPADFKKNVGPLPEGVKISDKAADFQQLHWFVKDRAQMEEELGQGMDMTRGEIICWIY